MTDPSGQPAEAAPARARIHRRAPQMRDRLDLKGVIVLRRAF